MDQESIMKSTVKFRESEAKKVAEKNAESAKTSQQAEYIKELAATTLHSALYAEQIATGFGFEVTAEPDKKYIGGVISLYERKTGPINLSPLDQNTPIVERVYARFSFKYNPNPIFYNSSMFNKNMVNFEPGDLHSAQIGIFTGADLRHPVATSELNFLDRQREDVGMSDDDLLVRRYAGTEKLPAQDEAVRDFQETLEVIKAAMSAAHSQV